MTVLNLNSHRASNIRKTWLLITIVLVLVISLGWIFSQVFNSPAILYMFIAFSLFMNLGAYWFSDKIALAVSGAKPASKENYPELFELVTKLASQAKIPMPRLYIMPEAQINAFATGRNPKNAAVAVTEGALRKLDHIELEGVLAHELSHISNRDILISTVVVVLAGLLATLADLFFRIGMFGGWSRDDERGSGALVLIISLLAAIIAPIAAMLIQFSVSRKREFLADTSGAMLTRRPEGLASALEKIGSDHSLLRHAHNSTAHLFISNPFKGRESRSWFVKLFMTHPPVEERIEILRSLKV